MRLGIDPGQRMLHRLVDVVLLVAEPRAPATQLALDSEPGLHREQQGPLEMPPHDPIVLASLAQPFGRVLADRLENVRARLGALVIDHDQRPAGEALDHIGHGGALDAVALCNLFGGVEREAACEDREPPETVCSSGSSSWWLQSRVARMV